MQGPSHHINTWYIYKDWALVFSRPNHSVSGFEMIKIIEIKREKLQVLNESKYGKRVRNEWDEDFSRGKNLN